MINYNSNQLINDIIIILINIYQLKRKINYYKIEENNYFSN